MIKNSVKNLSHFISLKTLDIWNIELQRNQLLKLSCVIIVCKMTILWQQIIDKKVKTPLSSFLSSLGLKSRSTHPTIFTNFFENEFLCPSTKLQDIPLLLPFSQSGDIFKDWRARPPTCQCLKIHIPEVKFYSLLVKVYIAAARLQHFFAANYRWCTAPWGWEGTLKESCYG